jgi:hypothetical protein
MNWSKASFLVMATLLSGITLLTMYSCNKKKNGTGGHTLYDSIGGAVLVPDPADSGQVVQQGWLNIRTMADSAVRIMLADSFPIPGDTLRTISGFFTVLQTELSNGDTTGYKALTLNLAKYFATATGCTDTAYLYAGKNMHDAHDTATNPRMTGKVDSADFNRFVYDIAQSATVYGHLSNQLISRLGVLLYSVEGQVVQP